jgi:hypothetical protein
MQLSDIKELDLPREQSGTAGSTEAASAAS